MEKDNMYTANEILQRSIGKRELRYGLMRLARSFLGWPVWVLGFATLIYGLIQCCGSILYYSAEPGWWMNVDIMVYVVLRGMLALFGIGLIIVGASVVDPYQFDTFMPGVESERKCLYCGHSLEPKRVFPSCDGCKGWFPLDINTYIGRSISKLATIINIIVLAIAGFLFIVR